jgi:hypothetical protein
MIGMLSGALGNVVASRNRYGAYLRSRVVPTKVSSEWTNDVRNRFSAMSKAWAAVSDGNKASWKTWAATNQVVDALGDSLTLQPSAAFIQLNTRILQAGGTQIDVPPVVPSPASIGVFTVVATAATNTVAIAWTSGAIGATEVLAIRVAVLDSPGRSYYRNILKLVFVSAAAAATPEAIGPEVEERFGTLIVGQTLHVEIEVWDSATGLVSGRMYANTVVV